MGLLCSRRARVTLWESRMTIIWWTAQATSDGDFSSIENMCTYRAFSRLLSAVFTSLTHTNLGPSVTKYRTMEPKSQL